MHSGSKVVELEVPPGISESRKQEAIAHFNEPFASQESTVEWRSENQIVVRFEGFEETVVLTRTPSPQ